MAFQLEPVLAAMATGTEVSIKAKILLRKPGITICQSVVNAQTFSTSMCLDFYSGEFSILDGVLRHVNNHIWVEQGDRTELISRPPPNVAIPLKAIEICSGIGAGSTGLQACGIPTQVFNDLNPKYCEWLERKTEISQRVIQGDINESHVVRQIADGAPAAQLISAGISCQPFSSLGDRREEHDDRSKSFTGTLRACHHLNPAWILLECTKEARFSSWAQSVLGEFCKQSGYQLQQEILDLHRTWPAFRTRWFAVLTHPNLPSFPIPSMPTLPWIPSMLHLIPGAMPMDDQQLSDLVLDCHELRNFNDTPKGIHGSIVNMCKPMATATHSWGSQCKPCECGCRDQGFSPARLRERGLYGQVIPLGSEVHYGQFTFHQMRHLHPCEVAVCNGLKPSYVDISGIGTTRFELTGVGQMASPLQIAWIVGNLLHDTNLGDPWNPSIHPLTILQKMFDALFMARDVLWHINEKTIYMNIFEQAITKMTTIDVPRPLEIPFTQQMFEEAAKFEASLARTARTAQVTQNIMPVITPLPTVSRSSQVLPRPHPARPKVSALCDTTKDSSDSGAAVPHLPMDQAPVHADPAHPHDVSGPSPDGGAADAILLETPHLPMLTGSNVHADSAHHPGVTEPSRGVEHSGGGGGVTNASDFQDKAAAISTASTGLDQSLFALKASSLAATTRLPMIPDAIFHADSEHHPGVTEPSLGDAFLGRGGGATAADKAVPEAISNVDAVIEDVAKFSTVGLAKFSVSEAAVETMCESPTKPTETTKAAGVCPTEVLPGPQPPSPAESGSVLPPTVLDVTASKLPGETEPNTHAEASAPPMTEKPPVRADPVHASDMAGPSHVTPVCPPEANPDSIEAVNVPLYSRHGGVNFSCKRPASTDRDEVVAKIPRVEIAPTAPWTQPIAVPVQSQEPLFQNDLIPINVGVWPEPLHQVQVRIGAKVIDIVTAESNIRGPAARFTVVDILGRTLDHNNTLVKDDIVVLFPNDDLSDNIELNLRVDSIQDRTTKLWYQEGFVATDEMKFYLQSIQDTSVASNPTVFSTPSSIPEQLEDLVGQAIDIAVAGNGSYCITVAALFQGHWFPLRVSIQDDSVTIFTTSEGYHTISTHAPDFLQLEYQWRCIDVPTAFSHDCGFRCVEWMNKFRSWVDHIPPMSPKEAIVLKHEFAVAIQQGDSPLEARISFGGATDGQLVQSLQDLLEKHGVATNRSHQCAESLIQQVGAQQIANILGGANAWRDLKACASQLKPPFQIVLASELQAQIQARAATQKQFGRKSNKIKHGSTAGKPVRVKPDQVILPEGIFHADQQPLSQISVSAVGRDRTGIALVSIDEALPFFTLTNPIAQGGLALIVLDHQDDRLPPGLEKVKFPAQFRSTDEPLLITGVLVQLGQVAVCRAMPERPIVIDEIPTKVIRTLAYRDQLSVERLEFIKSPVKLIREHNIFRHIPQSAIVDVWDRQYLDDSFRKVSSQQATLFAFNIRLPSAVADELHSASAQDGLYFEPRSENGRAPCSDFAMVWLPQKGLKEAILAAQTAGKPCWVTRSGSRYGLRVHCADAAEVHKLHRPDIDFIAGQDKQVYRLGPFPWGTTRQGLQKVFKEWGWVARVGQPAGQDIENRGVFWTAVAVEAPSHWVWTMAHGDILITQQSHREPAQRTHHGVVASQRTFQQLRAPEAKTQDTKTDPWLHYDPWGKAPKPAAPPAMSRGQLDEIEKAVAQRVRDAIQPEDAPMHPDHESRFQKLEEQVKTMTANYSQFHASVSTFQAQQNQHNTQVSAQITAIKQQVDAQASSLQGVIETKFEDQMNRLEALLSKRARSHEWQADMWHFATLVESIVLSESQIQCKRLYSIHYRIGEASNPGPPTAEAPGSSSLILGTCNPTGLLTKALQLDDLPGSDLSIWGVAETQLSAPGVKKFHRELKFRDSKFKLFHGAPAPLRSTSAKAIGGKHVGTAFLTTVPSRPLQATWTPADWCQARFVANTFYVQGHWIHGATFYGFAHQADLPSTREASNKLLSNLTYRVVHSLKGMRFICGDFNQLDGNLDETAKWAELGWREVQLLSAEKFGTTPQATCKAKTIKDFIWLSPELVQYFAGCSLHDTIFKDHSALAAHFHPFGHPESIPLWRIPHRLNWKELHPIPDGHFQFDGSSDHDPCSQLASEFEARVTAIATKQGVHVLPCQLGRSSTAKTVSVQSYSRPTPPSRHGDFDPSFHGISMQHARWIKQLRRLESFSRNTDTFSSMAQWVHRQREWRAILHATGFHGGFRKWWQSHPITEPGVPHDLPFDPPSQFLAHMIRLHFEGIVVALEQVLRTHAVRVAKANRATNPRRIFQDIQQPKAPLIELLEEHRSATVVQVCSDELAVEIAPDVDFDLTHPVLSSDGPVQVLHATPDKLWVADLINLQPGAKLHQEIQIGKLVDLFRMFSHAWSTRWHRHEATPSSRWQLVETFIDTHVPQGPVMPYHPITVDEWKDCIRRKKKSAAVGPDGWSREDLLALPDDLTQGVLQVLTAAEAGSPWPQSIMTGLIHSLQKTATASQVGHYRPITLCSLIYRVWSSIRSRQLLHHFLDQTPTAVSGNVPGRTTKHLWYTIQLQIEKAQSLGEPQSGCVVDLVKAFNLLPGEPLFAACVRLGAPGPVVRGWLQALIQLERRFIIRGGASDPVRSATGYPEGCGLSVVAMLATNIVASHWLRVHQPQVCIHSFVDNIELTAPTSGVIRQGFDSLCNFFDHMDLEWDPAKTYFWSTSAQERQEFHATHCVTRPWARDLGAHMQYTQAATNSVITAKIAQFQPQWKELSRSHASARQKKLALVVAAWPNLMHGISSVHLGSAHYETLRTKALRSFSDPTPGTSPVIALSLCEHPRLDPEFYALWRTMLDFRTLTTRRSAQLMLDTASAPTCRVRPAPGPCHVVLKRLHDIGWSWDTNQGFLDHHCCPFDPWECNFQEFQIRLVEAWQSKQCALISARKSFAGMAQTHAKFSTETKPRCEIQSGILNTCWNGTFYTANHLRHRSEPSSTDCAFCGQEDSAYHRNWTCPALESARQTCPPDVRSQVSSVPHCTSCHGWVSVPTEVAVFREAVQQLPADAYEFQFPRVLPHCLDLFTDGACLAPQDSFGRWASWGVVIFEPDSASYLPVAADLVSGLVQTIVRAEFLAAAAAIKYAILCRCEFRLWVDNQQVFQFLDRLFRGGVPAINPNRPNHDVKQVVADAFGLIRHRCQGIFKVCSHQNHTALTGIERWACEGNSAADSVATQVFQDNPKMLQLWLDLHKSLTRARRTRDAVHQVLIQVGTLAIHRLQGQADPDPAAPTVDSLPLPLQFRPWKFALALPAEASTFQIDDWPAICEWINSLHQEGDIHYLSWYHLYVDFSLRYPGKGPWYHVKSLRWWSASSMPDASWQKRCRWFSTYLVKLSKCLTQPLPLQNRRPTAHSIAFWINCLPVKLEASRLASIENWLSQWKGVFYKSKDLSWIDWRCRAAGLASLLLQWQL